MEQQIPRARLDGRESGTGHPTHTHTGGKMLAALVAGLGIALDHTLAFLGGLVGGLV